MKIEVTQKIDLYSILNGLSEKELKKVAKHIIAEADLLTLQDVYTHLGLEITNRQKKEQEEKEERQRRAQMTTEEKEADFTNRLADALG